MKLNRNLKNVLVRSEKMLNMLDFDVKYLPYKLEAIK